ncbi:hypothetical protein Csa_003778 [Cucumis sativus]|nr:hypothetical protein Csa_003778 [Cucumis sativus]
MHLFLPLVQNPELKNEVFICQVLQISNTPESRENIAAIVTEEDMMMKMPAERRQTYEPYPKFLMMERSKSLSGSYSKAYGDVRFGFEDNPKSYSFNGTIKKEDVANQELKRRQRVATYNMYSMEGKLKKSLRNSFKWIKNKISHSFYDD